MEAGHRYRGDPISYADAYYYDAVARLYTGELEKAEKSAREASRLDPDFKIPRSRYVLAAVLIEKKDYSGAATALRDYIDNWTLLRAERRPSMPASLSVVENGAFGAPVTTAEGVSERRSWAPIRNALHNASPPGIAELVE